MPALMLALVIAATSVQTDPIFVDANRLFNELEFEQAAFRYEQLALRREFSSEDRALVLMWLGTSQAKAGDLDNAARSYELALSLNPEATVPTAVSPKVVRLIDAIREKLRKTAAATAKAAAIKAAEDKPPEPPIADAAPDAGSAPVGTGATEPVDTTAPEAEPTARREQQPGDGDGHDTLKDDGTQSPPSTPHVDDNPPTPSPAEEAGLLGASTFPLAIGGAAGGAFLLVGSIAAGVTGALLLTQAFDLKTKQADAQNAYAVGVIGLAGAGVLVASGLAVAGGSAALFLSLGEE